MEPYTGRARGVPPWASIAAAAVAATAFLCRKIRRPWRWPPSLRSCIPSPAEPCRWAMCAAATPPSSPPSPRRRRGNLVRQPTAEKAFKGLIRGGRHREASDGREEYMLVPHDQPHVEIGPRSRHNNKFLTRRQRRQKNGECMRRARRVLDL